MRRLDEKVDLEYKKDDSELFPVISSLPNAHHIAKLFHASELKLSELLTLTTTSDDERRLLISPNTQVHNPPYIVLLNPAEFLRNNQASDLTAQSSLGMPAA